MNYSANFVAARNAGQAIGVAGITMVSSKGVECHGASYKDAANMQAAVVRTANARMFAFWQDMGVAMQGCPGPAYCAADECDANAWHVRDMGHGADMVYLPMAGQAEGKSGANDIGERSHIIASSNGGAYCPCNIIIESSYVNQNRKNVDMTKGDLSDIARTVIAAWPEWWKANSARKASLSRI